ncbi:Lrp/AsnC family transcriptional regulator [Kitasatospora sp. NPDC056327]|uniref:Lrp/AsnC family transcriptional regulator n=1 Tax=Kitasatospora sp. NPDC056327 TaxID=3345785 RepID=UPI0035E24C55
MDVTAADPDTGPDLPDLPGTPGTPGTPDLGGTPGTLDTLDRRLVCALQVNGRAGAGRIAEVLGISPRTVTRRLTRLQGTGLVRVVRTPATGDAGVGALLLRIRVLSGSAGGVAEAFAERPDVPSVDVMLGGREVGAVMLGAVTSGTVLPGAVLGAAGDRDGDRPPSGEPPGTAALTGTTVHAVLHAFADAGRWRSGDLDEAEAAALADPPPPGDGRGSVPPGGPGGPVGAGGPDELDRGLLARLGEDARQSHAMLAAAVGTPESTVRRRLHRLDEAGLLRTRVTVDPRLLGLAVDARLWLDVPPGRLAAVGAALARHPRVHGVFATSGPANLMAAVYCPDHGGLYRFVTGTLGPLGVDRAETAIVGRTVKRAGVPRRAPGPVAGPGTDRV